MKSRPIALCCLLVLTLLTGRGLRAQEASVPAPLQAWKDWVLRDAPSRDCPSPFNAGDQHICAWPSRLSLAANKQGADWRIELHVFDECWVALPGSRANWPSNVTANGEKLAVIERDEAPAARLTPGAYQLAGQFRWSEMPLRIAVPKQFGLLSLEIDGAEVAIPNWDANGFLWLMRRRGEVEEKDLLAAKVYRVLEDGIPLWLHTEVDLTVSGRSREEQLGWILPAGWQLATVESPIPVAVDDQGRIKAQVRAGNWKIELQAFRNSDLDEFRFAEQAEPVAPTELIAFRAKPDFRVAEIEGIDIVDANQTTFPDRWRDLPLYYWSTNKVFRLREKMRGMGLQHPKGLAIERHFWLDEDGQGLTYRDRFEGQLQQIWRLDVTPGADLGAVRMGDDRQLITKNPQSGQQGVEIRNRNLKMDAIGRIDQTHELSAIGWQTDAESLSLTLSLPPGWRAFAMLGADRVEGDWLTAWSLLDLFLLLIFSLAVLRLWGLRAGLVALLAVGLSYHEPGAPRFAWFFLLIPLALLRVVPESGAKKWIAAWKYVAVAILLLVFVPFTATQIQSAIYPQLESSGVPYRSRSVFQSINATYEGGRAVADYASGYESEIPASEMVDLASEAWQGRKANLSFDPQTKIQTGPAEPQWSWNQVHCHWSGPVSADQTIRPILISRRLRRILTVLRLALLLALLAIILRVRSARMPLLRKSAPAAALLALVLSPPCAQAQLPDPQILQQLREHLLKPDDAFPHAAEIAAVDLSLRDNRITMRAEIHAAVQVAVPLPGRLPGWSPLSVAVEGQEQTLLCRRDDGYLWLTLPPGVHQVSVEGLLPDVTEWEWTFLLPPRRVDIDAPGWNVTGVRRTGEPEAQVFFTRQIERSEGAATYDQKNFRAIAAVERSLEVGLLWNVRTTVTRLSAPGKAISLVVPLLPGESVLTSNLQIADGAIQANLGASQESFTWESEIAPQAEIVLAAAETKQWVERWRLVTSPVWNVAFTGIEPIFDQGDEQLVPVWHPWPGERVGLEFHRPEAVRGETLTVQSVSHFTELGARQHTGNLQIEVESSLGADFVVQFHADADVTSLTVAGQATPVRRDGEKLLIPVRPGKQTVDVAWTSDESLGLVAGADAVLLPVAGANVTSVIEVPENRWVLWAAGPLRGPAVRFWTILIVAVLVALALARISLSPLRRYEWVLLAIGLTQVHVAAAMVVVGWLFLLAWRGKLDPASIGIVRFNFLQIALVLLTVVVLGIFLVVVGEGLLGDPEMFIIGNDSSQTYLNWFQPRTGADLPQPVVVSISVWFYRLAMLIWALWLAFALLRWLQTGWTAFSHGCFWRRHPRGPRPVVAEVVKP
ncbi:MAG: hypothetical protein KDA42_12590 [Planctomycetales bacterium]|nr:hypothetical protein [Planctomycetales bacterium]